MRAAVEDAIRARSEFRGWRLHAVNARSNHVHLVVSAAPPVERVMSALKATATLALRERGFIERDRRVWTEHGSTRYLWTERDVSDACDYVVDGEG